MGLLGAAHGKGGQKDPPLSDISYNYETLHSHTLP